jgi:hypothetical protein
MSVALIGCSDNNHADDEPASAQADRPEGSSTSTSPEEGERQAVIEAYEGSVDARIEASAPPHPDPDSEALAETHTGPMLERSKEVILGLELNGWAIRYPDDSQHRVAVGSVTFQSDDVALLDVCTVDDGERVDVATGEVLESGVGTIESTAAMRKVDGRWRLAEREEIDRWEGVDGCAAGW